MLVLEAPEGGFGVGPGQLLPITGHGLSHRSYKVIHGWSLSVLDLKLCEKRQCCTGVFATSSEPEPGVGPQINPGHPKSC